MAKIKNKDFEKKEFVTRQELAEIAGIRVTTIKYYAEIGLLEFNQEDKGFIRKYPKETTVNRLKEIQKLKDKRFTIEEIKARITKL